MSEDNHGNDVSGDREAREKKEEAAFFKAVMRIVRKVNADEKVRTILKGLPFWN